MATQPLSKPEHDQAKSKKIQRFKELFAEAPEVGKRALENVLRELTSDASETPPPAIESLPLSESVAV